MIITNAKNRPTHHPTLSDLIQNNILELRKQHPDWTRLYGNVSGGNQKTFATFKYKDKTWKIHSDTKFQVLLTAWKLEAAGQEPFKIAATKKAPLACAYRKRQKTLQVGCIFV